MSLQSSLSDKAYAAFEAGRHSLAAYCVGQNQSYILARHLIWLIDALERVERGEITRLMIFMPPRHGKSETVSRLFPPWFLGRHPEKRILAAGHTAAFSKSEFGHHVFQYVKRPLHTALFPDFQLTADQAAKDNWKTTKDGGYFCAGIDAGYTGRGADIFLIDDPIKTAQDANSIVKRAAMKGWYESVARTRLEPKAGIIIVQTRWHEDDLSGWLLNGDEHEEIDDWQILSLSALAEDDEGWRPKGAALWPERYDEKNLNKTKRMSDQRVWFAMYQQTPSAIEGYHVKRSWFREYHWNPHQAARRELVQVMTKPYRIAASIDVALEEGQENDYSVIGIWLEILTTGQHYLLHVLREKMISTELFRVAKELCIYWQCEVVLIEDATPSKAFCQQMETTDLPIVRIQPQGAKEVRFQAVTHIIEGGKVFVAHTSEWKEPYINELCAFPTAAHDDQVDMSSQYLHWAWMQRAQREKDDRLDDISATEEEFNPFDM